MSDNLPELPLVFTDPLVMEWQEGGKNYDAIRETARKALMSSRQHLLTAQAHLYGVRKWGGNIASAEQSVLECLNRTWHAQQVIAALSPKWRGIATACGLRRVGLKWESEREARGQAEAAGRKQ